MASTVLRGSASFEFTGISGLTSPFLLAVPLDMRAHIQADDREQRFAWRSMDRSTRHVVTVPSDKSDMMAAIRWDDEPTRLRRFLRAGLRDELASLVYKSSSGATGVSVTIEEVMGGPTLISLEQEQAGSTWRADIRLVLNASDLDGLL